MRPKTISASSAQVYEACPARYKAEYIDRVPGMSGSAADLGTVVHTALQVYVEEDYYLKPNFAILENLFRDAYEITFRDTSRYDEGVEMLRNWFDRTDLLDGRSILSTEVKTSFNLNTSVGVIPFTYIFDRADVRPDGAIEVVDYKTVALPIQPGDLRHKIQPRVYALAAAIQYKAMKPETIWVSYDLLRYDRIALKFTREDNLATWKYINALAERILADDGTVERLNPECRWCVRKGVCETLLKNITGGGLLGITDLESAVDRRANLDSARKAISTMVDDLDEFILEEAERLNVTELDTASTRMKVSVKARREVDSERAAHLLPPEVLAKYGKLPVGALDKIIKETTDENLKYQLRQLIRKVHGRPFVVTQPMGVLDET